MGPEQMFDEGPAPPATVAELARDLGVSERTICKRVVDHSLVPVDAPNGVRRFAYADVAAALVAGPRPRPPAPVELPAFSAEVTAEFAEMWEEGALEADIADAFTLTKAQVRAAAKMMELPRRWLKHDAGERASYAGLTTLERALLIVRGREVGPGMYRWHGLPRATDARGLVTAANTMMAPGLRPIAYPGVAA